jgi:hypothetical protein
MNHTNRERAGEAHSEAWYTRGSGGGLTPTAIYSVACPDDADTCMNSERRE